MAPRKMRLTEQLVARVPPHSGESGRLTGRSDLPTDAEYAAGVAALLAGAPPSGEVWIFAFGSLIWDPGFDHAEERLATIHGWRRSFCIGWIRIYRGTPERPGIMLGLDRGGRPAGRRIPPAPESTVRDLEIVFRREHPIRWNTPHMRWVTARTGAGPVRALAVQTGGRIQPIFPASPRTSSSRPLRRRPASGARWRRTCAARSSIWKRAASTTATSGACKNW